MAFVWRFLGEALLALTGEAILLGDTDRVERALLPVEGASFSFPDGISNAGGGAICFFALLGL
jgi:hypothetical protein